MDLEAEGTRKYGVQNVLASSRALSWHGLAADLRHHPAGELPAFQPTHLEIGIAVASHADCLVTRRGDNIWQQTRVEPGIVWLCPSGVLEQDIEISHWHDVLHLYLSSERFAQCAEARGGADVHPDCVRYLGGLYDELLRRAGDSLLTELRAPTSAGRLMAESLAVALTTRIVERYAGGVRRSRPARSRQMLTEHRLRCVLQYMAEHLEEDIGLDDLARVAGLSVFHFSRMFASWIGMPPHRYLGQMRLERAKTLLSVGQLSLAEIAFACRFSSQPNFSRAFRRATGTSPLAFRNEARR